MRYRIFAATVAVITFAGFGTAIAAGPAQAAGSFHICLLNDQSLCLQSNGAGNQVTIGSSSYADFHVVKVAPDGELEKYWVENASGNCLRAGDNNVVKIENGPCNGAADWWEAVSSLVVSVDYGDRMLTHSNVSGYNVWHEQFVSGDWDQWTGGPF